MIRAAISEDVPGIVALARTMHTESPFFSRLAWSDERMTATAAQIVGSPHGFARVMVHGGELVGGMLAAVMPHWCSSDLVACDLGLFVLPAHRGGIGAVRMLEDYRAWAVGMGASLVQFGVMTGVSTDKTAALCERLGWERQGVVLCA